MKINWGFGVVIAFVGFISFIMYMVITMMASKNYNHDLVSDDYYKQELVYQKTIDASANAKELSQEIKIKKTLQGIQVFFPKEQDPKKITGKVFLYRPSNKLLDFEMPIAISNSSYLLMPDKRLLDGRWNIIVRWTYNNKNYFFEDKFFY